MVAPLTFVFLVVGGCAAFTEGMTASVAPFFLATLNEALIWWAGLGDE